MKALALLSGGLDSILATKLILDQGIEVVALNFILPFAAEKEDYAGEVTKRFGMRLVRVEAGEEYLELVINPKHGYGSGMNPCIDCHIYMLREAKRIAKSLGADFIFTGDVLAERPMSQYRKALELEEKEAIELAAKLTARYSDATVGAEEKEVLVEVKYEYKEQKEAQVTSIVVSPVDENGIVRLRKRLFIFDKKSLK